MIMRIGFFVLAILAIIIGLYPSLYFILDRTFGLLNNKSDLLLSNTMWNTAYYTHILLGGLALLIGWIQFSKKIRTKRLKFHRLVGKIYVISVSLSSVAGIYIGIHATGGIIAKVGFISLGLVWFYFTMSAYLNIRNGKVLAHQIKMIYSYAACFAAVMLRLWLPMLIAIFQDFIPAYQIVAWMCWVPNLIFAYFLVNRLNTIPM
jgi:uncharacterized membrane protein